MSDSKHHYAGSYRGEHLNHVAFPMGGIGAGMICLEGTGALSHVSLRGQPDVFNEPMMFAALCVKGQPNTARVLEGPVPEWKVFFPWGQTFGGAGNGGSGKTYGLPRCETAEFRARFPFGAVKLHEPDCAAGDGDHRLEPLHPWRRRQLQPARGRAGVPLRQYGRGARRGHLLVPRPELHGAARVGRGNVGVEGSAIRATRTASCCGKVPARRPAVGPGRVQRRRG